MSLQRSCFSLHLLLLLLLPTITFGNAQTESVNWAGDERAAQFQIMPLTVVPAFTSPSRVAAKMNLAMKSPDFPVSGNQVVLDQFELTLVREPEQANDAVDEPLELIVDWRIYPDLDTRSETMRAVLMRRATAADGADGARWIPVTSSFIGSERQLLARTDMLGEFALIADSVEVSLGAGSYGVQAIPTSMTSAADPFTGNSAYSLPLMTPPGPGGFSHTLALGYTSDAANAKRAGDEDDTGDNHRGRHTTQNSYLGHGWSLSGLGQITFELPEPGQLRRTFVSFGSENLELRRIGATWHTSPASFYRIEKVSDWKWHITTRSGIRYSFGNRDGVDNGRASTAVAYNVRLTENGCVAEPRELHLTEIRDTHGNRVIFDYAREEGAFSDVCADDHRNYIRAVRPTAIKHWPSTGGALPPWWTASTAIQINWAPREDQMPSEGGCGEGTVCYWTDLRIANIRSLVRIADNPASPPAGYDALNDPGVFREWRRYDFSYHDDETTLPDGTTVFDHFHTAHPNRDEGLFLTRIREFGPAGAIYNNQPTQWGGRPHLFAYGYGSNPDIPSDYVLTSVSNGQGGRSDFTYETTAAGSIPISHCYEETTSRIRVKSLTDWDGVNGSGDAVRQYVYGPGKAYAPADPWDTCMTEFEFLGYAWVEEQKGDPHTQPAHITQTQRTHFHQDDGGYPSALKGKPWLTESRGIVKRGANGHVWKALAEVRTDWHMEPMTAQTGHNTGSTWIFKQSERSRTFGESGNWIETRQSSQPEGNPYINDCRATSQCHPEITLQQTFSSTNLAAERETARSATSYIRNATPFLMNRARNMEAWRGDRSGNLACVMYAQLHYDGQPYNVAPTRGLVTEKWDGTDIDVNSCQNSSYARDFKITKTQYDAWGNPTRIEERPSLAAASDRTSISTLRYDTTGSAWPRLYGLVLESNASLLAPKVFSWDPIHLQVNRVVEGTGSSARITHYAYDPLSRFHQMWLPGAGFGQGEPSLSTSYEDYISPSRPFRITQRVRTDLRDEVNSDGNPLQTVTYHDGFGRDRLSYTHQLRSNAAGQNQVGFIGRMAAYDAFGRVITHYASWWSAHSEYVESPPPSLRHAMTTEYDVTGQIATVSPGGVEIAQRRGIASLTDPQNISLVATWQDEVGGERQRRRTYVDAIGRPLAVVEYLGNCNNNPNDPEIGNAFPCSSQFNQPWTIHARTFYKHDLQGNLKEVIDNDRHNASSNNMRADYDFLGRKTRSIDASLGTWTYGFDATRGRTTQRDARGATTCEQRDVLGRVTGRSHFPSFVDCATFTPQVTYTYTPHGEIERRNDPSGSAHWRYSDRGEPNLATYVIDGYTYSVAMNYTENGQLNRLDYPAVGSLASEFMGFEYEPTTAQLSKVTTKLGTQPATTLYESPQFDDYARVTSYGFGGAGVRQHYGYWGWDSIPAGALNWKRIYRNGEFSSGQWINYDRSGRISYRATTFPYRVGSEFKNYDERFAYDGLNRLLEAQRLSGNAGEYAPESYEYDKMGNLLRVTSGNTSKFYDYAGMSSPDRVTAFDGTAYFYDANGNVIRDSRLGEQGFVADDPPPGLAAARCRLFDYGADNRLLRTRQWASACADPNVPPAGEPFSTSQFVHDGDGNRVLSDIRGSRTSYIANLFEVKRERGVQTVTRNFLIDGKMVANRINDSAVNFLATDLLGSPITSFDAGGTAISEEAYAPWGSTLFRTGKSPTDLGFTGQPRNNDTQDYFYKFRNYNPKLRRFMQPDTIIPDIGNPQTFNRYAYALNNPTTMVDPSGHEAIIVCGGNTDCLRDFFNGNISDDIKGWILEYWAQMGYDYTWDKFTTGLDALVGGSMGDIETYFQSYDLIIFDYGPGPLEAPRSSGSLPGMGGTIQDEAVARLSRTVERAERSVTLIGQSRGAHIINAYLSTLDQPNRVRRAIVIAAPNPSNPGGDPDEGGSFGFIDEIGPIFGDPVADVAGLEPIDMKNDANVSIVNVWAHGDAVTGANRSWCDSTRNCYNVQAEMANQNSAHGHTWHTLQAENAMIIAFARTVSYKATGRVGEKYPLMPR